MTYFDAHIHIIDLPTLHKAQTLGVNSFICNATHPENWQAVWDFSTQAPGIYPCVGVHPYFINNLPTNWGAQLTEFLIQHPNTMIGEIGLDGTHPNIAAQHDVMHTCLKVAAKLNRPVHIHGHKAWPKVIKLLQKFPGLTCLFHRYNASQDQTRQLTSICNAYFSILTEKPLAYLPADRVLIETDSPDGAHSPEQIPTLVKKFNLNPHHLYQNFSRFIGSIQPTVQQKSLLQEGIK